MAGGLGPPRPVARRRRGRRRTPAPTRTCSTVAAEVLGAVRREKTAHKRSMRARVARLTVTGPPATLAAVEAARRDITDAGGVDELVVAAGDALSVEVRLADEA